ncbi:MAG TPA: GMC family oxidoreductase N-terminal domain-containing protein [Caulobacteraceae bacterium]
MARASADSYDYIVIGAGSSGCVIAARLSEDPDVRVLVLEAGGKDDHPYIHMPLGFLRAMLVPRLTWGYMSEPIAQLDGRRLPLPRGKVLGGSSSINGLFYMRGHPRDYDTWRQMGCDGWGYADVLPYFKRMETSWRGAGKYHGGSGPLSVRPIDTKLLLHDPLMATAKNAGYPVSDDLSGEVPEGFSKGEVTIDRRGRRASAYRAYLHPALRRPNLTIETDALTTRVLIETGRAVGVEISQQGKLRQIRAEREVILCGGAFNSPQLLMLSGIGPADELTQQGIRPIVDLEGVGKNLSEHPNCMMRFNAKSPVTFLKELRYDRAALSAAQWALLGSGPFATQINSCNVVVRTAPGLEQPDIQLMCNPVRMDAKLWFPGVAKPQQHAFQVGVVILHPHSRGEVTLRSASPLDPPKVQLNLMSTPTEFETMRRGIREARRIYHTPPQSELTGAEAVPGDDAQSDEALDAWIRKACSSTQHPVGTCSMGLGAEAVVGPDLRVIGIQGLRVADASIMPTVPGANTNASAIMVGEKASDLILGKRLPAEEGV